MTIMEFLKPGRLDEEADPSEYGFEVLEVEPLTEEDIILAYLKYRRTGGRPIKAWEKRLEQLPSDKLDSLKEDLETELATETQL